MKNDAEAVDRAAMRAEIARSAHKLFWDYGFGLALGTFGFICGGIMAWFAFQVWIAETAGFWYLTSPTIAFILGAFALAVVWGIVKLLRFIGRQSD